MELIRYEIGFSDSDIAVDDKLYIGEETIRVLSIVKVDFGEQVIYFHGVKESDIS
jgi:hypothetical protein